MTTANTSPRTKAALEDYQRALKLLGQFTRCTHLLASLESRANSKLTKLAEQHAHKFATLQAKVTEAEAEIKALATKHPEWFPEDDRTVKSLLGSIHAQKSTTIEIADDEATLKAIDDLYAKADAKDDVELMTLLDTCIVNTRAVRRDGINALSDELLARLGLSRTTTDSITVKPAKVKLGNAVKKATGARAKKAEVAA